MISEEFYQKKIQSECKNKTKFLINQNQLTNKEATATTSVATAVEEEQESDTATIQTNMSKQNNFKQEIYLKALKSQKKIKVPKKVMILILN